MTKGKYGVRADTRLKVLESEALREAHAKIKNLEAELSETRHELNTAKTEVQSHALRIAAGLSSKEKQNLRNRIASLEHQAAEERIRNAVVTWEVMHRLKFNRPSPEKLLTTDARNPAREVAPDVVESHDYWNHTHWEIAAIFLSDWDEFQRFCRIVEGYTWSIVAFAGASVRENTRNFRKSGPVKTALMGREMRRREYYDRIWKARLADSVEPMATKEDFMLPIGQDARNDLLKKMNEKIKSR